MIRAAVVALALVASGSAWAADITAEKGTLLTAVNGKVVVTCPGGSVRYFKELGFGYAGAFQPCADGLTDGASGWLIDESPDPQTHDIGVNTNTCAGPPKSCQQPCPLGTFRDPSDGRCLTISPGTGSTPVPLSEIFDAMADAALGPITAGNAFFEPPPPQVQQKAAMYRAIAEVYRRHGQ